MTMYVANVWTVTGLVKPFTNDRVDAVWGCWDLFSQGRCIFARNIPMCNSQRCSTEASLSQTKAQRMSTIEKVKTRIPFWETLRLSSDWEEQNGKLSLVGWSCRSRSRPSGASDELGSAKLNSANCHLLALPRVHQQCWTNIPSTDVHQSLDKMQDALQINQCWNWTISQNIFQGLILEKLKCTL